MFVIGTIPALFALLIRGRLKEPERWQAHRRGRRDRQTRQHGRTLLRPALAAQRPGRLRPGLFRRHRPVGHRLFQLRPHPTKYSFRPSKRRDMSPGERDVPGRASRRSCRTSAASSASTSSASSPITSAVGPPSPSASFSPFSARPARSGILREPDRHFWMIPIMGFCAAVAVRRLRDLLPGAVPDAAAQHRHVVLLQRRPLRRGGRRAVPGRADELAGAALAAATRALPLRYAGVLMCTVFVFGLLALPFAPETKGRPLPE